jgi:uncharacterized protein (TIGR03083 family)
MARELALKALSDEYGLLSDLLGSLAADELLAPSGCAGWTNAHLVFHMLSDPQRALVVFHRPTRGPANKDFITYWQGFQASDQAREEHSRFVAMGASAYSDPRQIVAKWQETADAAVRCAQESSQVEFIERQGHVLSAGDFLVTLLVEATIHHLDLLANVHGKAAPEASALTITVATLDGLWRDQRPENWEPITYILKATGRQPLTDEEHSALGAAAAKLPLFS